MANPPRVAGYALWARSVVMVNAVLWLASPLIRLERFVIECTAITIPAVLTGPFQKRPPPVYAAASSAPISTSIAPSQTTGAGRSPESSRPIRTDDSRSVETRPAGAC